MLVRRLYVAAYDISDERRLRAAFQILAGYAVGRQKSVFECFLTEAERAALLRDVSYVINDAEDSFLLVRLDPRSKIHTLGVGIAPPSAPFFYFG